MKIGIIIYTRTGNTQLVAEKMKERFMLAGHTVNIEQVKTVNDSTQTKSIKLNSIPSINDYDVLIFGSPVHGFTLCPIMTEYLKQLSTLKDKMVGCYVTQAFKYPCLGGRSAIKKMVGLCEEKGQNVYKTSIVSWSRKVRDDLIEQAVDTLCGL